MLTSLVTAQEAKVGTWTLRCTRAVNLGRGSWGRERLPAVRGYAQPHFGARCRCRGSAGPRIRLRAAVVLCDGTCGGGSSSLPVPLRGPSARAVFGPPLGRRDRCVDAVLRSTHRPPHRHRGALPRGRERGAGPHEGASSRAARGFRAPTEEGRHEGALEGRPAANLRHAQRISERRVRAGKWPTHNRGVKRDEAVSSLRLEATRCRELPREPQCVNESSELLHALEQRRRLPHITPIAPLVATPLPAVLRREQRQVVRQNVVANHPDLNRSLRTSRPVLDLPQPGGPRTQRRPKVEALAFQEFVAEACQALNLLGQLL
mmetsp:Transcript_125504/g.401920  ORF Transcript_125504/g.401920 Transcript_125504/m.401920 type:complete len:319 (+) Transcript_125504:75-1031(+)